MHRLTALLLLATLATFPQSKAGKGNQPSDKERSGLFLYNYIQFVSWPADAFRSPGDALRVQIIGRDPFEGSLDRLLADKLVDGRRIVVTHSAVPTTAPLPHVVFVSAAEEPQLATVLGAYCRAPVLTVSELDRFANRGGVIGLLVEDHALRFAINQTAATEARLHVSAQLMHLAVPLFSAVSPCGAR